ETRTTPRRRNAEHAEAAEAAEKVFLSEFWGFCGFCVDRRSDGAGRAGCAVAVEDPRARRDARVAAARGTARRIERRAARKRLPRRRAAENRREAAARPDRFPIALRFH